MVVEIAQRAGSRASVMSGTSNGASAALRTGDWDGAATDLRQLLAEELAPSDRSSLLSALITIDAARGEPTDALITEMDEALVGVTDLQSIAERDAALGWVALAAGRFHAARELWARITGGQGSTASFHGLRARAALWNSQADDGAVELAALEASGAHGPALEADRAVMRAAIASREGRTAEALAGYRVALRAWRELGLPFDEALTGIDMATVLDVSEQEVADAVAVARRLLTELGARPYLERLERLLEEAAEAAPAE
jgi:hypothetical protein